MKKRTLIDLRELLDLVNMVDKALGPHMTRIQHDLMKVDTEKLPAALAGPVAETATGLGTAHESWMTMQRAVARLILEVEANAKS